MEKKMKCVLLLSLKEIALRRVAVLLWSDSDILASISKFRSARYHKWLDTFEPKIKEKASNLLLPKLLMKQLLDSVRPIGLQLKRWRECQEYHFTNQIELVILLDPAKLCFTTAGAVDYRKTAEKLVSWNVLDVVVRYKLACMNCLESSIPLLWEKLTEKEKDFFYYKVPYEKPPSPPLHYCWPHILNGGLSTLDYLLRKPGRNLTSFNQWAFEHSAERGNKTASEYFFQKLKHEERHASLVRTACDVVISNKRRLKDYEEDTLFYLLSLMTHEQQIRTFQFEPEFVLFCFLDWPRRDLFSENAGLFWNVFLPPRSPRSFYNLYYHLCDSLGDSGPYFRKLFQEFFIQSPLKFKKYFVHREGNSCGSFLRELFISEDAESIKVIFRNLNAADKVKLVCNDGFFFNLNFNVLCKWHMVELCLREAMLSTGQRRRVKNRFMGYLRRYDHIQIPDSNLTRLFEFLDETDVKPHEKNKAKKRKLKDCHLE